jgi:hypothetical protein
MVDGQLASGDRAEAWSWGWSLEGLKFLGGSLGRAYCVDMVSARGGEEAHVDVMLTSWNECG